MAAIPLDLLDRIRALERQVRELAGRAHMRPALNQINHGAVRIGEGGSLDVRSPNGAQVLGVGQFGTGRYGVSAAREDGTGVALEIGGNADTSAQMIRLFARGGYQSPIVMDDAHADGYLGRPWIPIPCAPYVDFTSGDEVAVFSGQMLTQHKVLRVNLQLSGPIGTAAEVLMRIGGTQYGPTWTLSSTARTRDVNERIVLPAVDFPYGTDVSVVMWARRTAGAGTCALRVRGIWGLNTINANEAT
ncbi:hypothetical protein [Streptomyces sp. NPDC059008]|uniref:hypothetical protein n=1 Tax=Streptomyces sp. NPDC059008 TaxID=3346693 RepID=UPI00369E0ED2